MTMPTLLSPPVSRNVPDLIPQLRALLSGRDEQAEP